MPDRFTERAVLLVQSGQGGGRPLYNAARLICQEEDEVRKEVLASRVQGDPPLDEELFPRNVFNEDGTRKNVKIGTPAEERMNYEWRDSQGM